MSFTRELVVAGFPACPAAGWKACYHSQRGLSCETPNPPLFSSFFFRVLRALKLFYYCCSERWITMRFEPEDEVTLRRITGLAIAPDGGAVV